MNWLKKLYMSVLNVKKLEYPRQPQFTLLFCTQKKAKSLLVSVTVQIFGYTNYGTLILSGKALN